MNVTRLPDQQGQLLLEILIVSSLVVIIIALVSNIVVVGFRNSKVTNEKNVGLGLASEVFQAAQSLATEKWQNIYNLAHGTAPYHPEDLGGKWAVASSSQDISLNSTIYSRYFTVQHVCRSSSGDIMGITDSEGSALTCTSSSGSYDPSTEQITVSISYPQADPITISQYLERWRNKTCKQTEWLNGGSSAVANCPAADYDSKTNINAGTGLQLCSGGC